MSHIQSWATQALTDERNRELHHCKTPTCTLLGTSTILIVSHPTRSAAHQIHPSLAESTMASFSSRRNTHSSLQGSRFVSYHDFSLLAVPSCRHSCDPWDCNLTSTDFGFRFVRCSLPLDDSNLTARYASQCLTSTLARSVLPCLVLNVLLLTVVRFPVESRLECCHDVCDAILDLLHRDPRLSSKLTEVPSMPSKLIHTADHVTFTA